MKHPFKAHGFLIRSVVIVECIMYLSLTWLGECGDRSTRNYLPCHLALKVLLCGTVPACLLHFKHPVCYYCKTLFLIPKKLPIMHFKEPENH